MADEKDEIEKLKNRVAIWVLLAALGSTGVGGAGLWRFGAVDTEALTAAMTASEERIIKRVELAIGQHKLWADRKHHEIELNKPPLPTRQRQLYDENFLRNKFPGEYRPPTSEW